MMTQKIFNDLINCLAKSKELFVEYGFALYFYFQTNVSTFIISLKNTHIFLIYMTHYAKSDSTVPRRARTRTTAVGEMYRPEANNSFVKTTPLGSVDKLVEKGNSQKGPHFPLIPPIRALNSTAYNKSPLTPVRFYFKHRHVRPFRLTDVLQVGFNQLIFLLFLTTERGATGNHFARRKDLPASFRECG